MTDEKGLVFNDNQKRTTLRAKIDNRINSWLNIGLSGTFSRRDLSGESASLGNAYVSSPYGTWYYPDGEPTQFVVAEEQVSINPIRASILTTNEEIYDNLFSNFYGQVNLPFIKGLEYRVILQTSVGATTIISSDRINTLPTILRVQARLIKNHLIGFLKIF